MGPGELPRGLSIAGRTAEEDMGDPALLVKEGSAAENFQLTTGATDRVLGHTKTGLRSGQHGAVVTAQGEVVLMHADGAISQGDRLAPSGAGGAKAGFVQANEDPSTTFVGYALQAATDTDEFQVLFLANVAEPVRSLTLSPGSEGDVVADAFDVGLTQSLAYAGKWEAFAIGSDGVIATELDLSLQDGNGTVLNSSGVQRIVFTLHTDGTETLRVLDGSGTLSDTVELFIKPLDDPGYAAHESLTFS